MVSRTTRTGFGKASMMAWLLAFLTLSTTIAFAGINDDLIAAAKLGDLPEVKRLIAKDADVTTKDRHGNTALKWASEKGHREIVEVLLANDADVNAKNDFGMTALMMASGGGHREIVEALLAKGAEVNARAKGGETALMSASNDGRREVVQVLLDRGAEVNAKSEEGWTPLIFASWNGHREVVQALLARGADVNAKTKAGGTALSLASKYGHQEIQELLIKAGAKKSGWKWMDRRESDAASTKRLFIFGACLIALMVGGLWLWRNWRARVSEPDVGPQPDYLSSPPSGLPPALVFLVRKSRMEGDDNNQVIMATLIDLIQKGFLEIEFEETPVIVGHHRERDLLIRKGKGDPKYEFEKLVISHFAGHKLYGKRKYLGLSHLTSGLDYSKLQKSLKRESVSMGFFGEEPPKARMRDLKTGLVILGTTFAAFWLMLFSDGLFLPKDLMFWGVILPILTFLTFWFSVGVFAIFVVPPKKPKRTWQGVREAALWSAFGNHFRKVLLQKDSAGDYSDLWATYLPYVIIFGYLTHWKNRFVEMHAPMPYWFYTPVSHRPTAKSGGEPLTPDSVRQAFDEMVSSISNTIASTWKTGPYIWS